MNLEKYLHAVNFKYWNVGEKFFIYKLFIYSGVQIILYPLFLDLRLVCAAQTTCATENMYVLISIEAPICGYLEPKKPRARPTNKAAMLSWMKLNLFHLKGLGPQTRGPIPLFFWLKVATY